LLTKPNFDNGTNGWWSQGANVTTGNGEIVFNITNPGTNSWNIQLGQGGLKLRKGYKYTLGWRSKRESGIIVLQVQLDHGSYAKIFGTQTVHYNNWNESAIVYENTEADIQGVSVNVMLGGSTAKATFDYISLKEEPLTSNNPVQFKNPDLFHILGRCNRLGKKFMVQKQTLRCRLKD